MPPKRKKTSKRKVSAPALSPMYAVIRDRIGHFELSLEQESRFVIDDEKLYEEIKFYGVVLHDNLTLSFIKLCYLGMF